MSHFIWTDDFQTGGELQDVKSTADGLRLTGMTSILGDGSGDYVEVPWHSDFDLTTNLTIEAIANVTSDSTFPFVSKRQGYLPAHWQFQTNTGRKLQLWFYTNSWNGVSTPDSVFELNRLTHFAVTYSSGNVGFYVDGHPVGNGTVASPLPTGQVAVRLGAILESNQYYFNGHLAEVRIWNKALSVEQVTSNAYRSLRGDEPGLIALWRLNEASGTVITDDSGRGHNGTLNGGTWTATSKRFGYRLAELSLSGIATTLLPRIAWTSTEPANTGIIIETNISLDGGQTWQGWQACTNGGVVPGIMVGTDLSNARLKIWEHLHTTDPSVEPVLHSLDVTCETMSYRMRRIPLTSRFRVVPMAREIHVP